MSLQRLTTLEILFSAWRTADESNAISPDDARHFAQLARDQGRLIGSQSFIKLHKGTRPGSPIADAILHFVMYDMSKHIVEFLETQGHCEFARENLQLDLEPRSDDLAVPTVTAQGHDLVPALCRVLDCSRELFVRREFQLNFAKGKTGVVATFPGPASTALRQQYQLLTNRHLPCPLRLQLFRTLVLSRRFTLHTLTGRQFDRMRSAVTSMVRKVLGQRDLKKQSAAHVLTHAGILDPRAQLAVERLLYAQRLFHQRPAFLQMIIHAEAHLHPRSWLSGLRHDLRWLHGVEATADEMLLCLDHITLTDHWQASSSHWQRRAKSRLDALPVALSWERPTHAQPEAARLQLEHSASEAEFNDFLVPDDYGGLQIFVMQAFAELACELHEFPLEQRLAALDGLISRLASDDDSCEQPHRPPAGMTRRPRSVPAHEVPRLFADQTQWHSDLADVRWQDMPQDPFVPLVPDLAPRPSFIITFSSARWHEPPADRAHLRWPRPLRTTLRFFGLDHRTMRELTQTKQASLACNLTMGGFFVEEHPGLPRQKHHASVWKSAIVQLFRQHPDIVLHEIAPWRFGANTVKPTGLLTLRMPFFLRGLHHHAVADARRPVAHAIGVDAEGQFCTVTKNILKAYQLSLLIAVSQELLRSFRARRTRHTLSPAQILKKPQDFLTKLHNHDPKSMSEAKMRKLKYFTSKDFFTQDYFKSHHPIVQALCNWALAIAALELKSSDKKH
eukprot:s156_g25.t1